MQSDKNVSSTLENEIERLLSAMDHIHPVILLPVEEGGGEQEGHAAVD